MVTMGRFNRPVGNAVDEQDRIIVTDSTRGRLQVYSKRRGLHGPAIRPVCGNAAQVNADWDILSVPIHASVEVRE